MKNTPRIDQELQLPFGHLPFLITPGLWQNEDLIMYNIFLTKGGQI
jgi:hypothetical protein